MTLEAQPLPDLNVRVLARLSRLGVDGLVGLDYLGRFEYVHFHIPTLRLMLEAP